MGVPVGSNAASYLIRGVIFLEHISDCFSSKTFHGSILPSK